MKVPCQLLYAIIFALFLGCAILGLYFYQFNANIKELADNMLQGYWRMENDVYLLIDGDFMQIVDLETSPPTEYMRADQCGINRISSEATTIYKFDVVLPESRKQHPNVALSSNLTFELFPVFGSMIIYDKKTQKEIRISKDNELSMVHFATR